MFELLLFVASLHSNVCLSAFISVFFPFTVTCLFRSTMAKYLSQLSCLSCMLYDMLDSGLSTLSHAFPVFHCVQGKELWSEQTAWKQYVCVCVCVGFYSDRRSKVELTAKLFLSVYTGLRPLRYKPVQRLTTNKGTKTACGVATELARRKSPFRRVQGNKLLWHVMDFWNGASFFFFVF